MNFKAIVYGTICLSCSASSICMMWAGLLGQLACIAAFCPAHVAVKKNQSWKQRWNAMAACEVCYSNWNGMHRLVFREVTRRRYRSRHSGIDTWPNAWIRATEIKNRLKPKRTRAWGRVMIWHTLRTKNIVPYINHLVRRVKVGRTYVERTRQNQRLCRSELRLPSAPIKPWRHMLHTKNIVPYLHHAVKKRGSTYKHERLIRITEGRKSDCGVHEFNW
jgi:hypothetical protein